MSLTALPSFPYGAVYYRRSDPPERDWPRDYETARSDGMNAFRHWVLWGAVELAPGEFDWTPYDRQLDLAAATGLKTILSEMVTVAPEWAYRQLAHARYQTRDGRALGPTMHGSCAVGGAPGLCLDNPDALAAAGRFLATLAQRYRNHPALAGYDVWNECNISPDVCYCDATLARFREWLRERYGSPRAVGKAWRRYSFTDWDDVTPPRTPGPYPDTLDWQQFRIDNAYSLLQWRTELIRRIDPDCAIVAHGIAGSLSRMPHGAADDWRAAALVEAYGYTWGSSRHGDEPWKQYHAVDMVRAAARGKPIWHAEAYGGPLWLQPNVLGKPLDEGRVASPEDIRLWTSVSLAAGARGVFYLRWRPLLSGPLFGAFGPYGLDGERTPRSDMVVELGRALQSPDATRLLAARPVKGDIGVLILPEAQAFSFALFGSPDYYARSLEGAYQGFFANNIQADWVRPEHLDDYDFVYLPCPLMMSAATASRLADWVERGGTLVSEGCPAYWGDEARVGEIQPNLGLDRLFGVREARVLFTPDLLGDLVLTVLDKPTRGGIFRQEYAPTTGQPAGHYLNGSVAAVEHTSGRGRTLLVGTFPGYGHGQHPDAGCPEYFAALLAWAGRRQHVTIDDPRVQARLHARSSGLCLWLTNPTRTELPVRVALAPTWGRISGARVVFGEVSAAPTVDAAGIALTVPARAGVALEVAIEPKPD